MPSRSSPLFIPPPSAEDRRRTDQVQRLVDAFIRSDHAPPDVPLALIAISIHVAADYLAELHDGRAVWPDFEPRDFVLRLREVSAPNDHVPLYLIVLMLFFPWLASRGHLDPVRVEAILRDIVLALDPLTLETHQKTPSKEPPQALKRPLQ